MSTPILLLAGADPWESSVLAHAEAAGVVVLKRCVDLADLIATASLGQARVAVLSAEVVGLGVESIAQLHRADLAVLAVGPVEVQPRMMRLGADRLVAADHREILVAVAEVLDDVAEVTVADVVGTVGVRQQPRGRIIAVWGPHGAPGRTSVAISLADEIAAAGRRVVLVDADPHGGAVAARLGILDEASGLLGVARRANAGTLDLAAFAAACRRAGPCLEVLTGLPRADRRIEVRAEAMATIVEHAAQLGDVVVDTGFSIDDVDRDRMTVDALEVADQIVVVGLPDPIGLARLVRALVDLDDFRGPLAPSTRVVVNRFRPGLGWRREELAARIAEAVGQLPIRFVPEDGVRMDQALVTAKMLSELGESAVRSSLIELARDCLPDAFEPTPPRKRRRAGKDPRT